MTSYGDDPSHRPGSSRQPRDDDHGFGRDPSEDYAEPTTRAVSGRAQVGRASVPAEPGYGSPYGESTASPAPHVGRAQVRAASPSGPPVAGGGGVPGAGGRRRLGGFGLGGGRRDPDGDGRRGLGGKGSGDDGPGGKVKDQSPEAVRKRRVARIRNISITAVAVLVVLTGGGFVAGTLLVDSVELGEALPIPETSTIYYSDGTTALGRLGENTRYVVPYEKMSPYVTEAIVASEDRTFWTNAGVDFRGVMRAAWNNVTGGPQQGGSTITQQYARVAFDLKGATYNRKLREAVLAWKMSDELDKTEILSSYLNSVPFGRHAYGAEAAARAFFNRTIVADAPEDQRITRSEAMALVAMVKQPYPDSGNQVAYPGYDPTRGCAPGEPPSSAWPECTEDGQTMRAKAVNNATQRWEYVRDGLVGLAQSDPQHFSSFSAEEAAALQFPTFVPEDAVEGEGLDKPAGLAVKHVLDELSHSQGNPTFSGMSWQAIRDGGFNIVTTLDARAQQAAEAAADAYIPGSVMNGQPDYMQAALVSIDPKTGAVVAYYGGHVGTDVDFAGIYYGEDGKPAGYGRHPPGSSFKVYTLATALRNGYSLNSYWQWVPHEVQGRAEDKPIRNSADCPSDLLRDANGQTIDGWIHNPNGTWSDDKGHTSGYGKKVSYSGLCSLLESTVRSLNVPFYDLTAALGASNVLQTAYDAGVRHIWNNDGVLIDLKSLGSVAEATTQHGVGTEVGIGQYAITPLEHANGIATLANGGLRVDAHFVKQVTKDGNLLYGETLPSPDGSRVLNQQQVNDLTYAMSQVYPNQYAAGFQVATKTGTWEAANGTDNAHVWNVGFTTNLATVVYIGSKADERALRDKNGDIIYGRSLPREIWMRFMTEAQNAMGFPKENTTFAPPSWIGEENPSGSFLSPTPPAPPTPTSVVETSGPPSAPPTTGHVSTPPTGGSAAPTTPSGPPSAG